MGTQSGDMARSVFISVLLTVVALWSAPAVACESAAMTDKYSAVYGSDENSEGVDVYYPDGAKGEPLVVFVHGGAWTRGDKSEYEAIGRAFAECGMAFAIVNYRHAPAAHPDEQAAEVAKAVKWLRDRAGADTFARNKIFLFGHSAGAEIVALAVAGGDHILTKAGLESNDIAGVVAMDGSGYDPYSETRGIGMRPFRLYAFDSAFGSDPAKWKPYDVGQYLTGKEPPILVLHAAWDSIAPEFESAYFVDELKKAGDVVTYLKLPERDHFGVLSHMSDGTDDPTFATVERFIMGRH